MGEEASQWVSARRCCLPRGTLAETTPSYLATLFCPGLFWPPGLQYPLMLMGTRLSPHPTRGKVLGELAPSKGACWDTPEVEAKIAPA